METKTIGQKIFEIRKQIKPMKKDQAGYNYKYFDINQMIAVLQPLFEKYNLLVSQPLTNIDGKMALGTCVQDIESGQEFTSVTPLIELQDPQKMGGCITYFRRYSLQSLFFMEAEDDDASEATKSAKSYQVYIPVAQRTPTRKSEKPDTNKLYNEAGEEVPFK